VTPEHKVQIGTLKKITADAAETCRLAAEGGHVLVPAETASAPDFLQKLIAAGKLSEAVLFLAYALPKREAVWWACLCARAAGRAGASPPIEAALEAAEAWVYKPTDDNRRTCMTSAQATKFDAPGVWAAVAAFWSGGSMGPRDHAPIVPAPHLTGVAVVGAVTLAAVQTDPQLADQKRRRYIEMAIDIANGGSGRLDGKAGSA
jgi:hypothetical protein